MTHLRGRFPVFFGAAFSLLLLISCSGDDDGGGTGPVVPPESATLSLDVTSATLSVDDTLQLTATVADSAGKPLPDAVVDWSSSAESTASVSESGVVRAIASGSATVIARSGSAADSAEIQVVDAESGLRCERLRYPCNASEVPFDIRERSEELGIAASESLAAGASIGEVAAELEGTEGVVEVLTSLSAVVFRLEGGGPFWVFHDVEAESAGAPAPSGPEADADIETTYPQPVSRYVVGEDPEVKRALVLSPYQEDFGSTDEGRKVAEILNSTRGYRGNVDYLENDDVGPEAWSGWGDYDVIHVATHGSLVCPDDSPVDDCMTGVSTALSQDHWDDDTPGVWPGTSSSSREVEASLTDDYFGKLYPWGLGKTFIWINACQTTKKHADSEFGQYGLWNILTGGNGVYFGWSEDVPTDAAQAAAIAFYEFATEHGVVTASGLAELARQGLNLSELPDSDSGELVETVLQRMTYLVEQPDLRLREIISILDPMSGIEVDNSHPYEVIETDIESDEDSIAFRLEVDGVEDGEAGQFVVHVSVDGKELSDGGWPLSDGRGTGRYTWVLEKTAGLGFKAEDGQEVEIRAWVELPEDGISEVTRTVKLVISEFELHVDSRVHAVGSEGDVLTLHMSSVVELEYDDEDREYTGTGAFSFVELRWVAAGMVCIPESLIDGELKVESLILPDPRSGQVDLILTYGFSEEPKHSSLICDGSPYHGPAGLIEFFSAISHLTFQHGEHGEVVGAPTGELISPVFQVSDWDFDTDDPIVARRVYELPLEEEGLEGALDATIELRRVPSK